MATDALSTGAADADAEIILDIQDLSTHFPLRTGLLKAVDEANIRLRRGKTLCVVGESGSGKSVMARSILRIVPQPGAVVGGRMLFQGRAGPVDLATLDPRGDAIRAIRGREIAMIFQEPMSSLSPVHTIGFQIEESLRLHTALTPAERRLRAIDLLRKVEIPHPETTVDRYPFEYSGGMRQRAMIAMALACEPAILIADEPTTALDVTTQAEILDLMRQLQQDTNMALLFITHDMGVVAEIADEVCVMLRGKVVETGPVDRIFHAPQHPYTRRLIHSARKLETRAPQKEGFRPAAGPPLLIVQGLSKRYVRTSGFVRRRETVVDALKNVSLTLQRGESLGVVGESGSGKTTLGRCLLRMVEPTGGVVGYRPETGEPIEVTALDRTGLRRTIYRDMRMIFQDPFASLNPRMTVAQVIGEPLHNLGWKRSAIEARVAELLTDVGLRTDMLDRYPHAFSGGQRQRIGIARALAPNPRLIIADEATAALDVSIRSQVLDLLLDLQGKLGLSFVFISHDISVIRYFCDRVAVMYQGEVVEQGETQQVCEDPQHPYTKALLSAVPRPDPRRRTMGQRHRYADALRG